MDPNVMATIIESGDNWGNVRIEILNLDPFVILPLDEVEITFPFCNSEKEIAFFQNSNVTRLKTPIFQADEAGYNSANRLLGSALFHVQF